MSTYLRVRLLGGVYFFTIVTCNRVPFFSEKKHVEALGQAFRQVMVTRPFQIDAIVVLPEHLHCIWRMPEGDADYSSRWREIKKFASRHISTITNHRNERMVWQRRFWEHTIRDEVDWRKHMDYIHYNPVKHKLVSRPGDWPWSSFHNCIIKGWYKESWGDDEPLSITGMDCE
jgi:putative transposase